MSVRSLREAMLRIVRGGDDHTGRQITLMLCLYESDRTVRELADMMNVIKPVITRGVDRLVLDLYAERRPDPSDRRSVIVKLLPSGREFVETAAGA